MRDDLLAGADRAIRKSQLVRDEARKDRMNAWQLRSAASQSGLTMSFSGHLPENTGWPCERSSVGCDLARPVVPGAVWLSATSLVSTRSSVVTKAAAIAIINATAKSAKAVW